MKRKNYIAIFLMATFVAVLFFNACKKDPAPKNPYDDVDYGISASTDTLDPLSITAIHRDIVFPKCAKPGCHDGHFEPDFRTVESTYSTMVYQPITKNNVGKTFKYRVLPDSSSKSVLYERLNNCCFVNNNDRMPQDNIGKALPDADLNRIKTWIDNGAKDIFGQVALVPNALPQFPWWSAFDNKFPAQWNSISDDTNRVGKKGDQPVLMKANQIFTLIPWMSDDKTSVANFTNCKLLFSYNQYDFSSPVKTVYPVKQTYGKDAFWISTVNTTGLLTDTIIYMRFYCNDGDHAQDTEFPNSTIWKGYRTYWSLYIKP
ncbi:MAG: hypothetical protein NT150_14765 [Bacteroidetes bacterium]|nr:hypothetical protein [Bacteroidota bacterium]